VVAQNTDLLFSTDDWVEIYRTTDEWEVQLIQATLGNQQIRCRPKYDRGPDRQRHITLFVAPGDEVEAMEIVSRIGLAITDDRYTREQAETERTSPRTVSEGIGLPKAIPTVLAEITVAAREGIGKIVHYVGRGYELQVGPEPYYIVEEDRWEEFTDFSAQRQEFAILLKHEYPLLSQWLKGQKLMAEFIRLVEATYREVPPPRPRNQQRNPSPPPEPSRSTNAADARTSNLAKLSLWMALVSLFALIIHLPWYASLTLSVLTVVSGFVAKYRINASQGVLKGSPIAFLAVIIACIVIAMTWKQRPSGQPPPVGLQPTYLLFPMLDEENTSLELGEDLG
jgi:hypothetical protein